MKRTIFTLVILFLAGVIFPWHQPAHAACNFHESMTAGSKNVSWSSTCTVSDVEGIDDPNNTEGSTANVAVLTVATNAAITVNATGKLYLGSMSLTGGTVATQTGGYIKIGSPLYCSDSDADGWASSFTFAEATASGYRRCGLFHGFTAADCNDSAYSTTNSCGYRRNITISYTGATLSNYDILVELDTATLITAGKMTSDCGDIRMEDSDDTTALAYWIEGGCNTTKTHIWATVPSIPDGGKTVYLDYDGTTETNAEESWTGKFITLNTAACPTGWTSESGTAETYENKFPQGASTYGGTGGSSTSSHSNASCTSGSSTVNSVAASATGATLARNTHTHVMTRTITDNTSVWPTYVDVPFCSKTKLDFKSGQAALFDASAPTGWTRLTALDSGFPRGAASYGATGGATTHTHSTASAGSTTAATETMTGGGTGGVGGHTHGSGSATTGSGTHTPPYLDMVFASKDADGPIPVAGITMTDVVPPLGWTRFTGLDSKFPRGASTYGGTGGATTHNHTLTINPNVGGGAQKNADGSGFNIAEENHDHANCNATLNSTSNTPPYVNTIYIKKDSNATDGVSVSVGAEQ